MKRRSFCLVPLFKGESKDAWLPLFVFPPVSHGHVMSIYFDREADLEKAKAIWLSVEEKEP